LSVSQSNYVVLDVGSGLSQEFYSNRVVSGFPSSLPELRYIDVLPPGDTMGPNLKVRLLRSGGVSPAESRRGVIWELLVVNPGCRVGVPPLDIPHNGKFDSSSCSSKLRRLHNRLTASQHSKWLVFDENTIDSVGFKPSGVLQECL